MMEYFDFSEFLLRHTENRTFAGLNSCRMAAYFAQQGRCYATGYSLKKGQRQLHHRNPVYYGGADTPENTILLDIRVHRLVHTADFYEIDYLLEELALTERQLRVVNQLRLEAHMFILKQLSEVLRAA